MNLTPIGARRILGLPLETLTSRVETLSSLFGAEGTRLESLLGSESAWEARFDRLEAWLLARLDRAVPVAAEIDWLWQQLANQGNGSIGMLTTALGWSRQRMVSTCRHELGMAPKRLSRIIRFHAMTRRLRRGAKPSWGALASECGYHDQSHFIRETREFAGCTPKELAGHLLPSP